MLTHFINPFLKALLVISIIAATLFFNAFAQSNINSGDKQIHLKMSKEVDGKRTEIDTTFNNSDDADAFIKSFNDDADNDDDYFNFNYNSDDADKKTKSFSFNFHDDSTEDKNLNFNLNIPNWSNEDRVKFEADMKKLQEEMKKENLFNFHWDTSSMGNNFNYNFNFKMPDENEMEELKEKLNDMKFDFNVPPLPDFDYDVQGLNDTDKKQFEEQMKKAEEEYKKAMDLLKEKNGSIKSPPCPHSFNFNYNGDDDKADKNTQKKVIIIEKSDSKTDKNKSSKKFKTNIEESQSDNFKINDLKYFPNPNNGKFDLSFSLPSRGDLNVSISNAAGKKIYDETILDFSGEYSQSFDLSAHGAGVYLLNIQQGKEWMHKKVVVK